MLSSKSITLFLAAASTAAVTAASSDSSISANSRLGQSLLKNARSLQDNEYAETWMAGYSINFHSCATNDSFYGEYFGNDNYNGGGGEQGFKGIYKQRLAHFQLCPTDTCGSSSTSCNDYVTDLGDFLYAYLQNKIAAEAVACENVKESCYCENAENEQMCLYSCYQKAGLTTCDQQEGNNNGGGENGQQVNLEDAIYCTQLEVSDQAMEYYRYEQNMQNRNNMNNMNNYNNYNAQAQQQEAMADAFYVGPHCQNGKVILGLFMDETCSVQASDGIYEKMFYGQQLPHSTTSIIEKSKCMSCKVPKENEWDAQQQNQQVDANNYYYNNGQMQQQQQQQQYQEEEPDQVTEACGQVYEASVKCERDLNVYGVYPDTRGCNYISSLKQEGTSTLASLTQKVPITPTVLAAVFAATTVMFAGLSVHLNRKYKRSNVSLVHGEGGKMVA